MGQGGGRPSQKAAAPTTQNDNIHVGNILQDFLAEAAVAGDQRTVIKRVKEDGSFLSFFLEKINDQDYYFKPNDLVILRA